MIHAGEVLLHEIVLGQNGFVFCNWSCGWGMIPCVHGYHQGVGIDIDKKGNGLSSRYHCFIVYRRDNDSM